MNEDGELEFGEKFLLTPVRNFAEGTWIDGNKKWIQMYPFDTWDHPLYGETTINKEIATQLKANFDNGVRGQKVFTDFEHGFDPAKGTKASGEIEQLDVRENGLWGLVKFTDRAKEEIDAGEWNYFSTSHYDSWTNPHDNTTYKYVIDGGGLTNKPWVKGMAPVNFSELFIEDPKNFATKATKAPYGNVTYADPGYRSDKKKRYPIDTEAHIRAAWSYINMPKNAKFYSADQLASIKSKIRSAMRRMGAAVKQMSEVELIDILEEELVGPVAEVAPEEFMEPGTGFANPAVNPDDAADSGSRIDTPPAGEDGTVPDRSDTVTNEGGNGMDDFEKQIRELLDIGDDVDVAEHIKGINAELEPLRELAKQHGERKRFSELFPDEFAEMQDHRNWRRDELARNFSEKLARRRFTRATGETDDEGNAKSESTTFGLSALAVDELTGVVKKFSEGTATLDDFTGAVDSIMNNGIVDYGNKGSDLEPEPVVTSPTPKGFVDGRKMFNEKVEEIMQQDELDMRSAVVVAAEKHPELYEMWRSGHVIARG